MKALALTLITTLALWGTACAVETDDATTPDDATELAQAPQGEQSTKLDAIPAELTLAAAAVPAGCSPNVTCTGTKTCGAWSAYATCGASFQQCVEGCSFFTRSGCQYPATVAPQNRTRSCVMRATGATCIEIDYRTTTLVCPLG